MNKVIKYILVGFVALVLLSTSVFGIFQIGYKLTGPHYYYSDTRPCESANHLPCH